MKPVEVFVIAGIDADGELARFQYSGQAQRQFGATDSTGQRQDFTGFLQIRTPRLGNASGPVGAKS